MGAFDGESEAVRQSRFKSTLRLTLAVSGGSKPVFWKNDGGRFAGKTKGGAKPNDWKSVCSGSTLKLCTGNVYELVLTSNRPVQLRPGSGRWRVVQLDAAGHAVEVPIPLAEAPGDAAAPSVARSAAAAAHPSAPSQLLASPQSLPTATTASLASSLQCPPALQPLPVSTQAHASASTPLLGAQAPSASTPLYGQPAASMDLLSAPTLVSVPTSLTPAPTLASAPTIGGGGSQASALVFPSNAHFQAQGGLQASETVAAAATAAAASAPGALLPDDDGGSDPLSLRWTDVTPEDIRASRSTFKGALRFRLPPSPAGSRQYLLLEAHFEDFGHVVCPIQIKVYTPTDRGALSSFRLRHIQFDFREDSSGAGDLYAVNYYQLG